MIYVLDTANVETIKRLIDFYPIGGVTTNPTLISREKRPFKDILREIREAIGSVRMLHVQTLGMDAETIVKEAEYLNRLIGGNLYIKIPVIPEGIKAIKKLKTMGIKAMATAVFTPQQALIAAQAGADFVAPYVNRIEKSGGSGPETIFQIAALFKMHNLCTKILAASFASVDQINKTCLAGAHAVTVSGELMEMLLEHEMTTRGVEDFISNWEGQYGAGITTLDVE